MYILELNEIFKKCIASHFIVSPIALKFKRYGYGYTRKCIYMDCTGVEGKTVEKTEKARKFVYIVILLQNLK